MSGLKLIDLGQRGIYERFGAPVAVLGPGLHVLLPWPLGRLRPVEYGGIHSVAIGIDQPEPNDMASVDAEAQAPLALNRLWETSHSGQDKYYYLVPSAGTGPQGFQTVATEISVLYRVGLTDAAARQSVYAVADPRIAGPKRRQPPGSPLFQLADARCRDWGAPGERGGYPARISWRPMSIRIMRASKSFRCSSRKFILPLRGCRIPRGAGGRNQREGKYFR